MFNDPEFQFVTKNNAAQWRRVATDTIDALLATLAESDPENVMLESKINFAITQAKRFVLHCIKIQHGDVEVKF